MRRGVGGVLLIWLASVVMPAVAGNDHERARQLRSSGSIVPLEQILKDVKRRHPGRVLATDLEERQGEYRYEIEVVGSDGIVWEFYYNARTGELLRQYREQ